MADFLPELLMFAKTSAVQAVKRIILCILSAKYVGIVHRSFGELHIPSSQIVRAGSNFPPVGQ